MFYLLLHSIKALQIEPGGECVCFKPESTVATTAPNTAYLLKADDCGHCPYNTLPVTNTVEEVRILLATCAIESSLCNHCLCI